MTRGARNFIEPFTAFPRFAPLLLVALVWCPTGALAQEADGGAAGDWLSRYSGARSVGLGGAQVANANGPMAALWNPASMSRLFQNELHVENSQLFENTSITGFSFAVPAQRLPSLGFSLISLSSGAFERTNELNESLGSFEESDMAFVVTASKKVSSRVSLGTNLKLVRQSLEEFQASGMGFDLGLMIDVMPNLRLGASVMNLAGPTMKFRETDESYAQEIRGGAALSILRGRGIISAEIDHRSGPGATLHAGSEVWVHPSLALRVGYDESQPTGGMSYRVRPGMRIDYGVADHELGLSHRFGISYRFGGFYARSTAHPAVFSPTGANSVTKIHLTARTKSDAREWSLEIINDSKIVVRRFGGAGSPPAHIMWDGKDETGLPLADGIYDYQIVVVDAEGHTMSSDKRQVEISTAGPQGSVPVIVDP